MSKLSRLAPLLACTVPALGQGPPPTHAAMPLGVGDEADGPIASAFTPDGSTLLTLNLESGNVSFVDVASQQVSEIASLTPWDPETYYPWTLETPLVVAPDGFRAAMVGFDTLPILDLQTRSVAAVVPRTTRAAAFTGDGSRLVMLTADGLEVLDLATYSTLSTIDVDGHQLGLLADDRTALVMSMFHLDRFDLVTGQLVSSTPLCSCADRGLAVSADRTRAAVVAVDYTSSGTRFWVHDLATGSTVPYGPFYSVLKGSGGPALGIEVTDDGSRVVAFDSRRIASLDTATATTVDYEFPDEFLTTSALSWDESRVLITGHRAHVWDVSAQGLIQSLDPGTWLFGASASPVDARAAAVDYSGERLALYDLSTPAVLAHIDPGGLDLDDPAELAVLPSGLRALVAMTISSNVALVDLRDGTVLETAPVGSGPGGISATDSLALVGAIGKATLLELPSLTPTDEVPVWGGVSDTAVSQDGDRGYLLHGSSGDRVTAIDIVSGVATPAAGTTLTSGRELLLSPDGNWLVVLPAFASGCVVLDARTLELVHEQAEGSRAVDAVFRADSSEVFVAFQGGVVRQLVLDATGVTPGVGYSLNASLRAVGLDAEEEFLLVAEADQLVALDRETGTHHGAAPLSEPAESLVTWGRNAFLRTGNRVAHAVLQDDQLVAGAEVEVSEYEYGPADLHVSAPLGLVVGTRRTWGSEGLDVLDYGDARALPFCPPPAANSAGQFGALAAEGVFFEGAGPLTLTASGLPVGKIGYLLASRTAGLVTNPGGSQGNLCVLGAAVRFTDQLAAADSAGTIVTTVDPPVIAMSSGETWYFQLWYRDKNPSPTSNFTEALELYYR